MEDLDLGTEPRWHFSGRGLCLTEQERGCWFLASSRGGACYLVVTRGAQQCSCASRLDSAVGDWLTRPGTVA
ncbi:hypothetical protein NDU88_001677 [Pleurodeles waltl]|uniref:Uncharacterized protein n=1 Tax=Pleurodeles waltl TaxID=8319 RepID=A0AAV7T0B8_PLEWA|nr:hypothetical protein NDU88_001677 [Pleurodeles waltl]